ncbi:UNVERIFIED_CONTAM: RraA family protein [Microbacterium sp. SLM126]
MLANETYSAVFSDICDRLGLRHQALSPGLLPTSSRRVLIGWARTARSAPVHGTPERPYGPEIDFVDSLNAGDVAVLTTSGSSAACWGELFSTAAIGRGARGVVTDGLVRDGAKLAELAFPVFARGSHPTDCFGRLSIFESGTPIEIGGLTVAEGDLVVADRDGIVVVPRLRAAEVARLAIEKARTEDSARDLLLQGGYLREVWERYGVL